MKKAFWHKLFHLLGFLFFIAFTIVLIRDIIIYPSSFTSAPFSVWLIIDCIQFLLPGVILFVIGTIIEIKSK